MYGLASAICPLKPSGKIRARDDVMPMMQTKLITPANCFFACSVIRLFYH